MANPPVTSVQSLLPVQAYFDENGNFQTFIGQGQPFYATANPSQSGLSITNSIINSTTIGATTPSSGIFTNIGTTTGTISTAPSGATDIANKQYVDYYAAGLSWKQPVLTATSANITLSGLQTINGVTVVAGDRVLVKNQGTASENGIYTASATAWTYAVGADDWAEYVGAIVFVVEGSLNGTAWYCTAQPGGTLGTTAMVWSNFSVASSYTAGTGLTLTGTQFSITNTGLAAATYGSASSIPVIAFNAQGQATSVTNTTVTPAVSSITGLGTNVATWLATPSSANLAAAVTDETGSGSLVFATSPTLITPILGTPTSGNFSTGTFTWPTFNQNTTGTAAKATNLAGGAVGNVPYQSAADTTTFLATGTNGQVLTLASGVPSWATPTTGTVTSVSGTGTVNGITLTGTVTSSGSLTLGGTLGSIANSQLTNSSITFGATAAALGTTVSGFNAVTIGATTASTGAFTYLSTSSTTSTTPVLGYNASNTNLALGATVASTYLQSVMQNKSGTAGASTNFAVSNDLGTDSTYYGEFGMNSSVFSSGTPADFFSLNNGVYFSSHDGDVTIGSGNGYKTYLAWGTTGQSAHVINATGAIGLNTSITGSTNFGTSGQVLTSAGSTSTPTWTTPTSGITITDDTTTNATRYVTFTSATSGTITGQNVSSTKLQYNPSTGVLTSTGFSGSGASLTALSASNVSAGVLGTSYGGTGLSSGFVNGISWQSVQTGNFNATAGNGYAVNTTSGAITVTLPSSPSAGNVIVLVDYAGTWATNNVTVNVNGSSLNGIPQNATLKTAREGISFVYIDSTQGWIAYSGFQDALPTQPYAVTYLAVAGGGATNPQNDYAGGGGGGGGVLANTLYLTPGIVYTATVGGGGSYSNSPSGNGSNSTITGSTISTVTATGGGKGGTGGGQQPTSGGSGGGGAGDGSYTTGASGTAGQGYAGGNGANGSGAGGGGGAGAVGGNYTSNGPAGSGGTGVASSITGSSVYYAGGGGGGGWGGASNPTGGSGGNGGGGAGSDGGGVPSNGTDGTTNTGGGGGGVGRGTAGNASHGGNGGSGVVILSVPTAKYTGTTTGSPTITTSGSNTIIKFTSSGTYTA